MLCYDSNNNMFFNTENKDYIGSLHVCEVTKGIDDNIVIEKWFIPDISETVLYKRDINTLFSLTKQEMQKTRNFYFDLQFKKINVIRNIKGIIIPPKMYIMLQSSSKFIK